MTHVMEHKNFRYNWELVRHTYIVDIESEIDIQQVELSPVREDCIVPPPFPRTRFFEVEIDQIQKKGKTVFSLRNICPVALNEKADWNILNRLAASTSPRITERYQSQDGDTETRWVYTDDFFLISLSSGDRHDLDMLLSLVLEKLNLIALSVQSGRRIRSEFENQQKFRNAMHSMFSGGVNEAFRDVPVYLQHGEMTESEIDVSAALMSSEFNDLMAVCASGECPEAEITGDAKTPARRAPPGYRPAHDTPEGKEENADVPVPACEAAAAEGPSEIISPECARTVTLPDTGADADTGVLTNPLPDPVPEDAGVISGVPEQESGVPPITEHLCYRCGAAIPPAKKFCGVCGSAVIAGVSPEETPAAPSVICSRCGAAIPPAKKFCGVCGTAVGARPAGEQDPASPGITARERNDLSSSPSRTAAEPVMNLKSIEELEDLSWLSD